MILLIHSIIILIVYLLIIYKKKIIKSIAYNNKTTYLQIYQLSQ